MYFQSIDDKEKCVGIYKDGALYFDEIPPNLQRTWKYTPALATPEIEYGWIRCGGQSLSDVCPVELEGEWERVHRKMRAFKKSFELAKIDFRQHCFFDLVPHDFRSEFLEIKNKVTEHVFENFEVPPNYDHLNAVQKLLHQIKYQTLHLNTDNCKKLFYNSARRSTIKKLLSSPAWIDYNLFGTVTGRLATNPNSFPILTMKKEIRQIVKPCNDWFLSLDYNGAEVRTFLALGEHPQPQEDIHAWNIINVFQKLAMEREEAKTVFFAWLYNPDSTIITTEHYNRKKVLDKYYDGDYINTVYDRHIKVDERKAFNYLIQSTTADLVNERAVALDKLLKDKKSFISHIVHDEIVIDLADEDRQFIPQIKDTFSVNRLGTFLVNMKAGQNYYDLETLSL